MAMSDNSLKRSERLTKSQTCMESLTKCLHSLTKPETYNETMKKYRVFDTYPQMSKFKKSDNAIDTSMESARIEKSLNDDAGGQSNSEQFDTKIESMTRSGKADKV